MRKFISIFTIFIFTATTLFSPAPVSATPIQGGVSPTSSLLSGLSPEVCDLDEEWMAPQAEGKLPGDFPLAVILQEAHVNYLAQKNIVATLEHFQAKFKALGLGEEITIALEGNPMEEIDPVLFRAFPVPEVTRDVTNSFMWDGKIDGAEFYAINSNPKARLFGIDDNDLYEKNVTAYRDFLPDQEKCFGSLKNVRREIEKLKGEVYSKSLKDLEESRKRLDKDIGTLRLHLNVLDQLSKFKGISLETYPLVFQMKTVFEEEAKLDEQSLQQELIVRGLVRKSGESNEHWQKRVMARWIEMSEADRSRHPHLSRWIQIEERIRGLKSYDFFTELADLEHFLYERLARSRDERTLVSADRFANLLENLASLSLTQADHKKLAQDWGKIGSGSVWKSMDDLAARRKIPLKSQDTIEQILTQLKPAREFYEFAGKRDRVLTENLERLMEMRKQKIVFVIAGGFHTEGMTRELQKKGISYLALFPMADPNWDAGKYWRLLGGEKSPIETLLAQVTTVAIHRRQADPVFQREGMIELEAAAIDFPDRIRNRIRDVEKRGVSRARSMGLKNPTSEETLFLGLTDRYIEALRQHINNPTARVGDNFLEALLVQFQMLRNTSQSVRGNRPIPLNIGNQAFFFYVRRYDGDWNTIEVPEGFVEIPLQVEPPHEAIGGVYFGLSVFQMAPREIPVQASPQPTGRPATARVAEIETEIGVAVPQPVPIRVREDEQLIQLMNRFNQRQKGKYRIDTRLGGGGMGVVFQGFDILHEKEVAIKVITAADSESEERFKREAQATANVEIKGDKDHAGVVRVHDIDRIEERGQLFFVMDYIPGEVLSGEGKTIEQSVDLVRRIANTMHLLHRMKIPPEQKGIIHRDLKPANIILRSDGVPFITDFGLVKVIDPRESRVLTRTGDILGTPMYMAPEQALSKKEEIGPRTDIYSLGVILYQMLAGRPPFEGQVVQQVLMRAITETAVSLRVHNPDVPEELEEIIFKAMEKEPRNRYRTAKAFADDLQKFLDKRKMSRREFLRWLGAGTAVVSVIGTVAGAGIYQLRKRAEQRRQEEERRRQEEEQRRKIEEANAKIESGKRAYLEGRHAQALEDLAAAKNRIREMREAGIEPGIDESMVDSVMELVQAAKGIEDELAKGTGASISAITGFTETLAVARDNVRLPQNIRDYSGLLDVKAKAAVLNLLARKQRPSPDEITRGIELGRTVTASPYFAGMSAPERSRVRFHLSYFFHLSGDRDASRREYRSAMTDLAQADERELSELEVHLRRAYDQAARGEADQSLASLRNYRDQATAEPRRFKDFRFIMQGLIMAEDLTALGTQRFTELRASFQSMSGLDSVQRGQPGTPLAAVETALENARQPFRKAREVLSALASVIDDPVVEMRARMARLDSLILEVAWATLHIRKFLEERPTPGGMRHQLFEDFVSMRNQMIGQVKNFYLPFNEGVGETTETSVETLLDRRLGVGETEAERTRELSKYPPEFLFSLALFADLQISDLGTEQNRNTARERADILFRFLSFPGNYRDRDTRLRNDHILTASQIILGEENNWNFVPESELASLRGFRSFAIALWFRRASILEGRPERTRPDRDLFYFVPQPGRVSRATDLFDEAFRLLGQGNSYSELARTLAAEGRSLGGVDAEKILKHARKNKKASVAFLPFSEGLFEQLMREDFRAGNQRKMFVLLVSPKDEAMAEGLRKDHPELWQDYGIQFMFDWPGRSPLSRMNEQEAEELIRSANRFLRKPFGGEISLEDAVFINDGFLRWEKTALRIRVSGRFATDSDYRTGVLAAAFDAMDNPADRKFILRPSEEGDNTFVILDEVLADIMTRWKATKAAIVAA